MKTLNFLLLLYVRTSGWVSRKPKQVQFFCVWGKMEENELGLI